MRTIKFRGKRVDTKQWMYGMLNYNSKGHPTCIEQCGFDMPYEGTSEVIPKTIGQFTGLTDKNGKEIYEGDIVKVWHRTDDDDGFWTTGICEYAPAEFYIRGDGYSITCHFHYNDSDRAVIGNIHDNPELLKEAI